ncbi:MAG: patatin-like phospholipase family protein [Eubacteriales bacterium]|nr:patatin-like phospholipase family protein [Eubacteriales bacterium]
MTEYTMEHLEFEDENNLSEADKDLLVKGHKNLVSESEAKTQAESETQTRTKVEAKARAESESEVQAQAKADVRTDAQAPSLKVVKSTSALDVGKELLQKIPDLASNLTEATANLAEATWDKLGLEETTNSLGDATLHGLEEARNALRGATKDSLKDAKNALKGAKEAFKDAKVTLREAKETFLEVKDKFKNALTAEDLADIEIENALEVSQAFCKAHPVTPKGSCLVIQGGALRGIHSLGVLVALAKAGLSFDCVMGVSAGSLNGLSFVAGQLDRASKLMVDLIEDEEYIGSWSNVVKDKPWINFDFMFAGAPGKLEPFDLEALMDSPTEFICNATELETGKAVRFSKSDAVDICQAAIASSTLPLVSNPTKLGDKLYMDGGVAEPILYTKALEDGYQKIVVILTRPQGFRQSPMNASLQKAISTVYSDYPHFAKTMLHQETRYNQFVDQLEQLAEDNPQRFFLIYPQEQIEVKVGNRSPKLMQKYLDQGEADADAVLAKLQTFLAEADSPSLKG